MLKCEDAWLLNAPIITYSFSFWNFWTFYFILQVQDVVALTSYWYSASGQKKDVAVVGYSIKVLVIASESRSFNLFNEEVLNLFYRKSFMFYITF